MKEESRDERGRRIQKLWETLDNRHEGQIDLKGFQAGLRRMDHRAFLPRTTDSELGYLDANELCSS